MQLYNNDPNFSIVLPGGCNAKCDFCFSQFSQRDPVLVSEYVSRLADVLSTLPRQFYQISITGGEPMLSKYLPMVLGVIAPYKKQFTNVLLTTNGTDLVAHAEFLNGIVDHVNISRHHYDEDQNKGIFGGSYQESDKTTMDAIKQCSVYGIDVSFNCVIPEDMSDVNFIFEYIRWAQRMGGIAVRFRKQNGTLDSAPIEKYFENHKVLWRGECPVCRTKKQLIAGMPVYWKTSIVEPSEIITEKIFELIFDKDGKVYADWNGQRELSMEDLSQLTTATKRLNMSKEKIDKLIDGVFEDLEFEANEDVIPPPFPLPRFSQSCGGGGGCGKSSSSSCGGSRC